MQKEIENLECVQCVNFKLIDSFKNNGTKYLLIFDNSCEEICDSKAFVDIATAGGHRGLSALYIKHNLFHCFFLVIAFFMAIGFMMGVMTISCAIPIDLYKSF